MSADATARVAEKLQAVYDGADPEERAVLDELGGLLRAVEELAAGDEVVGFATVEQIKAHLGTVNDLESQDRLGNFEIQNLMSDYNSANTLSGLIARRWPPGALI